MATGLTTYACVPNDAWMVLCAPTDARWQKDLVAVAAGELDLIETQVHHHAEGFRFAEIVRGMHGWYVRTRFQGGEKVSPYFLKQIEAIKYGRDVWYAAAPDRRELIIMLDLVSVLGV